jgi:hypothetical protein
VFVGEQSSWDRDPLNGYQVIFVPFANERPSGMPPPVLTDFLAPDKNRSTGGWSAWHLTGPVHSSSRTMLGMRFGE